MGACLRDAADGDEGDRRVNCVADAAEGFEADGGGGVLFGVRVEDGAEGDVVDGEARGFDGLRDGVRGVADDEAVAEQAACGGGVEIVLAEVDAVRAEREGDVGAVVDDDARAAFACDGERGFGVLVELARREMLFAELDKLCAAVAQARDLFGVREAGEARVGDGVEFR